MKKLALGLILAALSSGVFAQGAEVAGTTNVAAGAGGAISANAALIAAGVVTAGRVATGANTEITTSH